MTKLTKFIVIVIGAIALTWAGTQGVPWLIELPMACWLGIIMSEKKEKKSNENTDSE